MADAFLAALEAIVGDKGLVAQGADMVPYLHEERGLYRGMARTVVRPASTDEVARVVALCAHAKVPIIPQGGNTGLCGGAVPQGGLVLALGRMNKIREIDALNNTITAEAGVILETIQQAADAAGCLFPLSLGAEGTCQIGGNISTNAGGTAVLRYGNTRDLVLGLEVVLPDGSLWNGLRSLRKDNTGYDLKHLFIGAEGTLGIITAAVLKLFPKPHDRATALVACPDLGSLMKLFGLMRDLCGDSLSAFEMIARFAVEIAARHVARARDPFPQAYPYYALVELTSPRPGHSLTETLESVLGQGFEDGLVEDAVVASSVAQAEALWALREAVPEAQKHEGGSIKHDVSVPVSKVAEFIIRGVELVERELPGVRPCPFGHVGDGNIHFNLTQPEGADKKRFLDEWSRINRLVHDLVAELGGSFSAEHGIGQLKLEEMAHYKSPVELALMRRIKDTLDPAGIMNPGKVVPR